MKKSIYGLLLLLAGGLLSCEKEVPKPDPCISPPCTDDPDPVTKLDTLWTYLIDGGGSPSIINNMEIYKNKLIVSFEYNNNDRSVRAFDIDNRGNLLWRNIFDDGTTSTKVLEKEGILYNKSWNSRSVTDIESGHIAQEIRSEFRSNPRGSFTGNDLYFCEYREPGTRNVATLYRTDYKDLSKAELVYTLTRDYAPNENKSIESANLWVNPLTGDSILIFQHRMSLPNRVDVIAWNMSRKDFEWKHDDLTRLGNSNVAQFMIIENRAYFMGGTAFYCFDMFSGDILWQFNHPSGINSLLFYKPLFIEEENMVVLKDDSSNLYAFDADSGATIWVNNDAGNSSINAGSPKYYNGVIYYVMSRYLWAVRVSNGEILWSEKSDPNNIDIFNGEVAVDPERGCLYVSDRKYLYAVKLYGE